MKYNKDFPFNDIEKNDKVVIVDFDLQKEGDWEKLLKITPNVVWIDHHASAIKKAAGNPQEKLEGSRKDGTAACKLAWEYFNKNEKAPKVVELVNIFDIWNEGSSDWQSALLFNYGSGAFNTSPDSSFWQECIDAYKKVMEIIGKGETVKHYEENKTDKTIRDYGYETKFNDKKCFVINAPTKGSMAFGKNLDKYDMCANWTYDGKIYNIGLYSNKDNINVSDMCKKYGGGGHKGAGGFQSENNPFVKG